MRNWLTPRRSHSSHARPCGGGGAGSRSRTVTRWPSFASSIAEHSPTIPPPMTTTFVDRLRPSGIARWCTLRPAKARPGASRVRQPGGAGTALAMTRLRRVSPASPGWTRRRAGRGFVYFDEDGARLDPDLAARCRALVIPPAWEHVWICPLANGHIQAVGTDAAGRRQYLYHPVWREQRDAAKHDRVLVVAARLPQARRRAGADMVLDGMPRQRALATAFRLLDLGLFRVGGEAYAEENGSYGLATIERRHVVVAAGAASFEYTAKSGQERLVVVRDRPVVAAVADLRRRRGGGPELLAYRDGRRWRDVTSDDINAYVKEVIGGEVSAKDFRTWHGTVLAAVALAERAGNVTSNTARSPSRAPGDGVGRRGPRQHRGRRPPLRTSTRGSSTASRTASRSHRRCAGSPPASARTQDVTRSSGPCCG